MEQSLSIHTGEPVATNEQCSVEESLEYQNTMPSTDAREIMAHKSVEDDSRAIQVPVERGSPSAFKDEVISF